MTLGSTFRTAIVLHVLIAGHVQACQPSTPGGVRGEPSALPASISPPAPPALAPPEEMLACKTHADCAITCRIDGDCCTEQCGCSQPMNRAFLKRLEQHLTKDCGNEPVCPVASCVGEKKYAARCDIGLCVAHKLPGSA